RQHEELVPLLVAINGHAVRRRQFLVDSDHRTSPCGESLLLLKRHPTGAAGVTHAATSATRSIAVGRPSKLRATSGGSVACTLTVSSPGVPASARAACVA